MTPAQLDLALGYIAPYGVWSNQLLIIFENSAEDKQPSLAQPTGHGIHHSRFIRAKGKISEENKREHTRQGVPSSCTEYGGQALARNFTEAPGNSVMVLRSGGDRPPWTSKIIILKNWMVGETDEYYPPCTFQTGMGMDGWMEWMEWMGWDGTGWISRWLDGWMVGWMDGWINPTTE